MFFVDIYCKINVVENKFRKLIREKIELDIEIGDELLGGRFKNKKVIVKDIGKDEKNQPTINGKSLLKFRIKKLIKETIEKLFEVQGFQSAATEQMATNMSLFKFPRKGIDDSINNYNLVQSYLDKINSEEEREIGLEDEFDVPAQNTPNASVSTNVYESKEIEESYGMYGSTTAAQKNLDCERPTSPTTANFNKDAQDEFDLYNDNIDRSLNEIPPGNSRSNGTSNNKSKNF